MLNKLTSFSREYTMITPGDHIICAVSGGADSMALLWSMYLLKDSLGIRLSAAHFNHHLRGEESDADEVFVREFCDRFEIELYLGGAQVKPGQKGLEAAAREARYAFFATLPGKIATAHTADDNAETVLLHLVRGTGLKGLGGIAPVRGNIIRPMLTVTRQEVLRFLQEYHIGCRQDSSNDSDQFLRNRLRHQVMPLLKEENPRLAVNLSSMARSLRQDEQLLTDLAGEGEFPDVSALRQMHLALRGRVLERFLKENGVREPEREHILLLEQLVFSVNPSAKARFPGNVTVTRCYDRLAVAEEAAAPEAVQIRCPGTTELTQWGLRVVCTRAEPGENGRHCFSASPEGTVVIRSRLPGDTIRLSCGTKKLKKLFIDQKIPASQRSRVAVLADDMGVLGIPGIGVNLDRQGTEFTFCFETVNYGTVRELKEKEIWEDSDYAQ